MVLRPRSLAIGLVVTLAVAASWWACSGQESSSPATGGGTDGGFGATAGTGGSGAVAGGGGKGGSGGSIEDAGEWGPAPTWQIIPGTSVGCTYKRMTNAKSIRFLKWQPCSWTDGCEQALFNPVVFGTNPTFTLNSMVFDDGTTVRAGVTMSNYQHMMAAFFGDDGIGLDAVGVAEATADCFDSVAATSIWGQRFAVHVVNLGASDHFGGILGDIGALASPPVAFTIPEPPPSGATQGFPLGKDRWLWWWAPVDRFSTVSDKDGSGFQIFAAVTASSPAQMYLHPTTTGPLFLAEEYDVTDGGQLQGKLVYSDGVAPMKPYLVPANSSDDYTHAAFADTSLGFMKGINRKDINVYDSVEIWATPYSANPSDLKPEFIAQYPLKTTDSMSGGFGRLAALVSDLPDGKLGVGIYTLASKSVRSYPIPDDHKSWDFLGLTRTHFWMGAATPTAGGDDAYLMRFKVE